MDAFNLSFWETHEKTIRTVTAKTMALFRSAKMALWHG